MTWSQRLMEWGQIIESDSPMPAGAAPMLVGMFAGLALGTMDPEFAGTIRREIEADMARSLGVPAESVESIFRELISNKVRPR